MMVQRIIQPGIVVLSAAALVLMLRPFPLFAQAEFRVDVNLVELHVTVADRAGRITSGLPQSAFQIYEDGIPQQITLFRQEDAPVAVGLVVDKSGSMRRKLPDVVAAADAFARSSNPQDQMFIVNFNEHVSLGLPSGEVFVSDPNKLKAAMLQIRPEGETALYDAIATASEHLRRSALQKKVLVVLSDGGDNASTRKLPELLTMLQESDAIVYTVGLFDEDDKDSKPGVLKRLAKVSGGEAFFPKEIPAATSVLEAISRDIRNQYTIGYVPLNAARDGKYRAVRVQVIGPHGDQRTARTRTGYVAAPPDSVPSESQKEKQPR